MNNNKTMKKRMLWKDGCIHWEGSAMISFGGREPIEVNEPVFTSSGSFQEQKEVIRRWNAHQELLELATLLHETMCQFNPGFRESALGKHTKTQIDLLT